MRGDRNRIPGESRFGLETPASRLGPKFHFTDVPAELRERIIEELKSRPEFKEAWEAESKGAGISLSLKAPQPVEFSYDSHRFTAFAWMGEIHVWGSQEPFDQQ